MNNDTAAEAYSRQMCGQWPCPVKVTGVYARNFPLYSVDPHSKLQNLCVGEYPHPPESPFFTHISGEGINFAHLSVKLTG